MLEAATEVHPWNRCYQCERQPIEGPRFECQTCPAGPDRDLCVHCYSRLLDGSIKHPKMRRGSPALDGGRHRFRQCRGASGVEQLALWSSVAARTAATPQVADRFLLRPEFQTGRESFLGTYGFPIRHERAPHGLFCTALHVLDELARNAGVDCSVENTRYTGEELPAIVSSVVVYDAFAPKWIFAEAGTTGRMIVLPDTRTGEKEPFCQRDVALFTLPSGGTLHLADLAPDIPDEGDPVWLVASRVPKDDRRTMAAVAVACTPQALVFRFTSREEPPRNTSGAPLIDESGKVIGVNVGCGYFSGHHFGHAVHSASIQRLIASWVMSAGNQS